MAALFRLSGSIDGLLQGALTLFVVPDIVTTGPQLSLWALSGSIPVPPRLGTPRSGIAVSAVALELDPVWAGQVMAHEIGHALGLYHTTERDLVLVQGGVAAWALESISDPLDDTLVCAASSDRDGDGILSSAECNDQGAANLMFWAAVRNGTHLSRGQADIARRAALVK